MVTVALSPRHRRWRRLVASLTLDPDALELPLDAPPKGDFLICGSPRTGTALVAAMLHQPPAIATVMEPWDALRLPPAELFASLRIEIATGVLTRGRLDLAALDANGKVVWCRDSEKPYPIRLDPTYVLGVKLPAFWRYLDLLPTTKFVVCLRHPVEVVASYRATGGRLAQGFDYEAAFNHAMNTELAARTDDLALRRVLLHEYIMQRIIPHLGRPNVLPVRYERWFTEPEAVVGELSRFLAAPISSSRVRITAPPPISIDPQDVELIREHCTSVSGLGYDLSSWLR